MSWTERVYLTTMEVPDNGILAPLVVSDPAAQQTLLLKSDNTLIGPAFHGLR
ncbi:MAG TPA: hypothetical protein VJ784_16735 [Pyrinomonadaceae bacterium]|nr:hypothetical protein [Pyrinomonadaceae bacterium]